METFTLFRKGKRLQFSWRKSSKDENEKSKVPRPEPLGDTANSHHSLVEAERGLSAEASGGVVQAFASDYLNRTDLFNRMDETTTDAFHTALPAPIKNTHQELDEEELLNGIISCVIEKDTKALVRSVLGEWTDEIIRPQQQQVARFATEQLIDRFLLECLTAKMSLQGPGFSEKEHSSMILDSLIFDILLQQFFCIQQHQRATFENSPMRDFHLKAFTEVALDVILTELNKLAAEDMEDLLEYERGVQGQEQMC